MIRRDKELTDAMYALGAFRDKKRRSYIANWHHPGTSHRCEYRFGELDKGAQRQRVYEKSQGFCQGCDVAHYIGENGEWDHKKGGLGKQKCDCLENGHWVCRAWHARKHVHIKWTPKLNTGK